MNSLTIAAIVAELNKRLAGARINKVFQPTGDEIYLRLWTGVTDERLYLLCRPQQAALYLTEKSFPNPFTPPRFCQLLRSRLTRLISFEQIGGDRLVQIRCAGRDRTAYQLLVDLRPKPNLVLLDTDQRIVDLLRRGGEGERPGEMYAWPRQIRTSLTAECLPIIPQDCSNSEFFRTWLLHEVSPMSRLAASDMAASVQRGEQPDEALQRYRQDLAAGNWQPRLVSVDKGQELSVLPLYGLEYKTIVEYAGVSQALDRVVVDTPTGSVKAGLAKTVREGLKRLRRRLTKIESDYASLDDTDSLQHTANLLLSNLHRMNRGMQDIEVEDYASDPPVRVTIQLDPRLSPHENAEKMFKMARKRKRGEAHYRRRRTETRDEIDWLEAMQLAIEETDDALELDALQKQLAEAGYLKLREEPVRRQGKRIPVRQLEAVSPSGYQLVWGRNPRENDRISRELAAPEDLWFHAHNMPGCHLLLRRAGRSGDIPEQDVLFAAALAAGYSRGRSDSRVEVIVAPAKDVKKPKGAKPGLVTVGSFRTVAVKPERLENSLEG